MANTIYWSFVQLARGIFADLSSQNLVFVGKLVDHRYTDCHFVDPKDLVAPFQDISFNEICADSSVMKEFLFYAYKEAREEYLDNKTR